MFLGNNKQTVPTLTVSAADRDITIKEAIRILGVHFKTNKPFGKNKAEF